jgi:hypothetical protein
VLLECAERRPARLVQSDDLAVDYGFIRHWRQGLNDGRIPRVEILVIARPQMDAAGGLESYCPKAIEL